MMEKDGLVFIDWENAKMSDPYFDLSMLPIFLRLDEASEKEFLAAYFGRPPTQFEWDRLFLRAAVFLSGLGEGRTTKFYDEMLNSREVPKYRDVIRLHEDGKLNLPKWKIGLSFMEGGFELVESEKFKASLQRLQNRTKTRIYQKR